MHSSRMCNTRSSSHLLAGGCLPHCMLGYPPPWVWAWTPTKVLAWTPLPGVGLDTPWLWAWTPLGVGLDTPPGVGLDTPMARPLNLSPGCGPGDPLPSPSPWTEFLTHASSLRAVKIAILLSNIFRHFD